MGDREIILWLKDCCLLGKRDGIAEISCLLIKSEVKMRGFGKHASVW